MNRVLELIIRTPHQTLLHVEADSVRLPTETGQIGLRPRCEAAVLAVEPGLIVWRSAGVRRFAGTAGGLLRVDGRAAVLLTPIAVAGEHLETVSSQLDAVLSSPDPELEVRRTLGRLETQLLRELHGEHDPRDSGREGRPAAGHPPPP